MSKSMSKLGGGEPKTQGALGHTLKLALEKLLLSIFKFINKEELARCEKNKPLNGDGEYFCMIDAHENIDQCAQCRNNKVKLFDKLS